MVEDREKSGGVDAHQPIRFLAAKGALVQGLIVSTGAQVRKALPDGVILHGGNPEPLDRLAAPGHFIHQPEDKLSLPASVTGVDDDVHIGAPHKGTEVFKGYLLAGGQHITEGLR